MTPAISYERTADIMVLVTMGVPIWAIAPIFYMSEPELRNHISESATLGKDYWSQERLDSVGIQEGGVC